jgi:hypothetical protein
LNVSTDGRDTMKREETKEYSKSRLGHKLRYLFLVVKCYFGDSHR